MRVDEASKLIRASPGDVYQAFTEQSAVASWLPPSGMRAKVGTFDFREGGGYRVRLTYEGDAGRGKTSADSDEVEVSFLRLVAGERIEQAVRFDSDEPHFAGTMMMTWLLEPVESGTKVTVRAEQVPPGISPEDHAVGLRSTLDNLASFVESMR